MLDYYSGNPLALRISANVIRELFGGHITDFFTQEAGLYKDVRDLLSQQFCRISELEKATMFWLAINREPVHLNILKADFTDSFSTSEILEVVDDLKKRSLIERSRRGFTLQNVVMEYVILLLREEISKEFLHEKFFLIISHALEKATSKESVREAQASMILRPIAEKLSTYGVQRKRFIEILSRNIKTLGKRGYFAKNFIDIAFYMKFSLIDIDFSGSIIREFYFREFFLKGTDFRNCQFSLCKSPEKFGSVTSLCISPCEETIAVGDGNGDIFIRDIKSQNSLAVLRGHKSWIWSIKYSPNGNFIVSGSEDCNLIFWWRQKYGYTSTTRSYGCRIWSIAFSSNGKLLATAGDDGNICFWETNTFTCVAKEPAHKSWIRSLDFFPQRNLLVSGSEDGSIKIWKFEGTQLEIFAEFSSVSVRAVSVSPTGVCFASGHSDNRIRLWDINSNLPIGVMEGHSKRINSLSFNLEGNLLLSASDDGTVRIWDVASRTCINALLGHRDAIRSICPGQKSRNLISGSEDASIRIWDLENFRCNHVIRGYINFAWSSKLLNHNHLVTTHEDGTLCYWQLDNYRNVKVERKHSSRVTCIAHAPGKKILASGGEDNYISIWKYDNKEFVISHSRFISNHYRVWGVDFSNDGSLLASAGENCQIIIWSVDGLQILDVVEVHKNRIRCLKFSPCDRIIASGDEESVINLYDISKQSLIASLNGHSGRICSLSFDPTGKLLFSASYDQTIKIWNLVNLSCLNTFQGHTDKVNSVAYFEANQKNYLVSGSHDCTIRFWDLDNHKCVKIINAHSKPITSVSVCKNPSLIVSTSLDETIKLWDVKDYRCVNTIRAPLPYEGMEISGSTGLTSEQYSSLMHLGAIDRSS